TVYFAVDRSNEAEPKPGRDVSYTETEPFDEFFVGEIDQPGQSCHLTLFQKETTFSDTYEYWPTGRLRKRTMITPDRPPSVMLAYQEGNLAPCPEIEPASDEGTVADTLEIFVTGMGATIAARELKAFLDSSGIPGVRAEQSGITLPSEIAPLRITAPAA